MEKAPPGCITATHASIDRKIAVSPPENKSAKGVVCRQFANEDVLVEWFVVDARQAGVEHVLDGEPGLGARRGLLPPVEDERLLEPV